MELIKVNEGGGRVGLSYEVEHDESTARLRLHGELDFDTVGLLYATAADLLSQHGVRHVVVDLTDVALLDSMAVGALVRLWRSARNGDRRLTVTGAAGAARRVLSTAGVLDLLSGE